MLIQTASNVQDPQVLSPSTTTSPVTFALIEPILSLRPFGTDAGLDLKRMIVMFGNPFHDRAVVAIPVAPLCVDSGATFQSNVLDLSPVDNAPRT